LGRESTPGEHTGQFLHAPVAFCAIATTALPGARRALPRFGVHLWLDAHLVQINGARKCNRFTAQSLCPLLGVGSTGRCDTGAERIGSDDPLAVIRAATIGKPSVIHRGDVTYNIYFAVWLFCGLAAHLRNWAIEVASSPFTPGQSVALPSAALRNRVATCGRLEGPTSSRWERRKTSVGELVPLPLREASWSSALRVRHRHRRQQPSERPAIRQSCKSLNTSPTLI
jgi:hypothetical protein